jgi:catechol 2,3-dioxygenase
MAASQPLVAPTGLDHVNLRVQDMERSLRFYQETLGLADYSVLGRGDDGRPSFVQFRVGAQVVFLMSRSDYAPPADRQQRGLNHSCLLIQPTDPQRLMDALRERSVPITGTRGNPAGPTFSVYVEDPDGHGIELEQQRGGA